MAAKRRRIVTEDLNLGFGPTTIPTDSGGTRAATMMGIHSLLGNAYLSAADQPGEDAGARIATAISNLPATGGTVDARSLTGAQTWGTDPFIGLASTKPVHLILGIGTTVVVAATTIPINVAISFSMGSILSMSGVTLTVRGQIIAGLYKIFAGTTVPAMHGAIVSVYPQWFGATGDGVTDDWAAIQAAEDSIISGNGSPVNNDSGTPAGTLLFPNGVYYITQPISTCHFNGCPGDVSTGVPAGAINAGITIKAMQRGAVVLFSDQNIDMIQMYNWSRPSSVEDLNFAANGQDASHGAIRVRGNLTTVKNCWFLSSIGVLVESTAGVDTANTKIIHNQCDWINAGGGVVNCVYITRTGGSSLAPQGLTISDLDCFGGNLCIVADHLYKSVISDVRSNHGGSGIIQLGGANPGDVDSVSIVNVVGDATNLTVQPQEFGISLLNATNINISNYIANSYQGSALIANASGVNLSNFTFINNVQNAAVDQPFDIYAVNSDLILKGGQIINNTGNPVSAIRVDGVGDPVASGSYDIDGVIISGTQYSGTVIRAATGLAGMRRLNITNNELRNVNTGGATSTILVDEVIALTVSNNYITDTGIPTNWLEATWVNTITSLAHNIVYGAENISLNGTSFGGYTDGTFNGATRITQAEFGDLTLRDQLVVAGLATFAGGATVSGSRFMIACGANVTAANDMTLGSDGNMFVITGNTQINCIANTGWQGGTPVYLIFTGTPTLKYNQSCGAGFSPLILSGAADMVAAANNTIILGLPNVGEWIEFGRKV